MHEQSEQANTEKTEEIMDVNQNAVIETMQTHSVSLLIHGHTHRPAIHEFKIDDHPAKRIVLSDWHDKGGYLRISENTEAELISFN